MEYLIADFLQCSSTTEQRLGTMSAANFNSFLKFPKFVILDVLSRTTSCEATHIFCFW